jgi:hypothetical protein
MYVLSLRFSGLGEDQESSGDFATGYSMIETTGDGSGGNFHTRDLADCIAKSPFKETLIPKDPHQRWAIPEHLNRRISSAFTTFALPARNREDLHILRGHDI